MSVRLLLASSSMTRRTTQRRWTLLAAVALAAAAIAAPSAGAAPDQPAVAAAGSYPLHTSGRWILDSQGKRVKLASVNWDGAESPEYVVGGLDRRTVGQIAQWIKSN